MLPAGGECRHTRQVDTAYVDAGRNDHLAVLEWVVTGIGNFYAGLLPLTGDPAGL
jgi:hypothetical protein